MLSPTVLQYLSLLRCPLTGEPLTPLDSATLNDVNAQITSHTRLHRDGTAAPNPLTDALGNPGRTAVYRVENDILWLLSDLALVPIGEVVASAFATEKKIVQSFYDEFGWAKSADGKFNDTTQFTDVRTIADDYRIVCNARIGKWLPGGVALLDAASGAIPHPEYLDLGRGYQVRICVDFSIRALSEARAKLGDRGLYILGDLTRLPFATGAIDSVISLHTVYHVPQPEQTRAIDELVRVCRPGGRTIVVYVWGYSLAMSAAFGVRGCLGWVRRLGRAPQFDGPAAATSAPSLYFHPQNHDWYRKDIARRHRARLRVWSSLSTMFQTRFVSENGAGRLIIRAVELFEWALPGLAGRFGQYPMFVIDKV